MVLFVIQNLYKSFSDFGRKVYKIILTENLMWRIQFAQMHIKLLL